MSTPTQPRTLAPDEATQRVRPASLADGLVDGVADVPGLANIDALARTVTPAARQNALLQALALRPEVEGGFDNALCKQQVAARLFDEPEPPGKIGRFTVIRELGRGGTGIVYIAYDEQLDRKIAVKLLNNERPDDASGSANARLLREAQAMARVSHPNIAAVHEVGMFHGQIYVAMEFVHGQTLSAWHRQGPVPWQQVLAVFRQAAAGLAAAHEAGLVHRDFKPANAILGEDGRVRVLDFGLARADASPGGIAALERTDEGLASLAASMEQPQLDLSLTVTGTVLGTPAYMSPEQFIGKRVEAKSDQFSFCVALFEALFRERPFDGDTLPSLMTAVLTGKVRDPSNPARAPRWLRLAVLRGLRNDPEQRWPSMRALELALTPERPTQRWTWVAALGVGAALTAGATSWFGAESPAAQVCSGAESQVAGVWDDDRRQQVHTAMLASGATGAEASFERIARHLDEYTESWIAAHRDACEGHSIRRDQSAELMDLRMACLAERRHALAAAAALLGEADAQVVEHAAELTLTLPAIAACSDPAYVGQQLRPPADPNAARLVEAARTLLTEASTRERVGKYAQGLELARQAAATAKTVDYPPLSAEVDLRLGALLELDSQYAEARVAFERAYFTALAAGHHAVAIDASIALVLVTGRRLSQSEVMQSWARHAEAYIRRAGTDLQRARLDSNLGLGAYLVAAYGDSQQRGLKAREFHLAALPIYQSEHAELDIARTLGAIGETYDIVMDDPATAERYLSQAITAYERIGGPEHPGVALSATVLGMHYIHTGDFGSARTQLERGNAILSALGNRGHRNFALNLNGLATLHLKSGDPAAAEPLLRQALEIHVAKEGPLHVNTMGVRMALGTALAKQGKHAEAITVIEACLDDLESGPDPWPWDLDSSGASLAEAYAAVGRLDQLQTRILPMYEQMLAPLPADGSPWMLSFTLGQLLADTDLPKARALVETARARAASYTKDPEPLAKIEAWLAKHPASK
ncbi:MAG: serine/threonine protein kinase [Nannocystis sp.]|nr:serine/threonine-protein kinase [Nannocystis sp.]MBA3545522.1 serine/threonine protein kinase [Nannocystis sp.]